MADTSDLVSIQNAGVGYLGRIVLALQAIFPQTSGTATTATAGAATLPANPAGFMTVTLPSGVSVKIAYYNN